jgi:UDP-hydrolysing UDP-N-acetyl-D-glucosamine 2-epimerase
MKRRPRPRILIITGSRSEFGLLRPVMQAVKKHKRLELQVAVAGEHLLAPTNTWKEVAAEFRIDAKVPMQRAKDRGRLDHAGATARGMSGFAAAYKKLKPDWVVVLGDRIEAFAAASAASIAGIAVCHIHGGDRAEGIADEAMRHAITKLAHLHCAATKQSAQRVIQMGENTASVSVTGSPAIDGMRSVKPMSDRDASRLGDPVAVVLLHPSGFAHYQIEVAYAGICWEIASNMAAARLGLPLKAAKDRVLLLAPNSDPGSESIRDVWSVLSAIGRRIAPHMPRAVFLSLLRRLADNGGVLIGNSSAGLIEAAALGVRTINVGPRQSGRERGRLVVDMPDIGETSFRVVKRAARLLAKNRWPSAAHRHPFGDGRAAPRIASLLAKTDPHDPALLRKRNSY